MDRQILEITANEQMLVLDNPIRISTNKVSYIEARFSLGQNWSGFDSVRAVWFNDYQTISTVLDSNGHCLVPFEVMKRKGKVKVNLVGSISDGDVLTDRLTSYPIVAVVVDCVAPITGAETSPITPSQFEQFVQIVHDEVEEVTGMSAEATTLPAGSDATASYSDGVLSFGIPRGEKGEAGQDGRDGEDGNGIESAVLNSDYTLTLNFTDGTSYTTTSIRGAEGNGIRSITKTGTSGLVDTYTITFDDGTTTVFTVTNGERGETGLTPSFSIGTVETLQPTEQATATITGTDENPVLNLGIPKGDAGEVTLATLESVLPTDTASGSIATFPDGTSLFPAKAVKVSLEPIQDLHGYDKPWSGGNGDNILDPSTKTTYDGANGLRWYETDGITLKANQAYTFKYYPASSEVVKLYFRAKADGAFLISGVGSVTYTPTEDTSVYLQAYRTNISTDDTRYLLTKGSTAPTSWTPYSNICPISGRTECEADVSGVNMFDKDAQDTSKGFVQGRYLLNNGNDQNPSTPSEWNISEYISVKPNTQYILSGLPTSGANVPSLCQYDADKNFLTGLNYLNSARRAITTQATTAYIRISIPTANASEIQLELGSTATDYEPYHGNTYPVSWQTEAGTVYGADVEAVEGELVDKMGVKTIDQNSTVTQQSAGSTRFYVACNDMLRSNDYRGRIFCDKLQTRVGYGTDPNTDAYVSGYPNNGSYPNQNWIYFSNGTATSVADIKAWLANNPLQVVYELATPQTYTLTPTEIALFDGTNNVWSDGGDVEVTYKADVQMWVEKKLD